MNRIPYVIDNISVTLADVLRTLLAELVRFLRRESEEQQGAALVAKPVAEEQIAVSHILGEHQNDPGLNRNEVRELRKTLKEPLAGASAQTLRRSPKAFSSSKDVAALVETVRGLAEQQRGPSAPASETAGPRLRREDLHLICYEYVCS